MSGHEKEDANPKPILPSAFMRRLRPELYSDTGEKAAYVLDAPLLEFHLESLTSRNESHDFEVFCRKLCERTICPHLRPQSGPEGGGDSKADSDTVTVSDEIARLAYVGEANANKESWAFAFSAKAKWTQKVRDDVKGIVGTGRNYDRIYFVTSKPARAKTRAELEQQLTATYGIRVTILDRAWIVKEVIENDRKDLAFNYLGVGQLTTDPLHLGPDDYSRTRQLADIEKAIEDPAAFDGMEGQRVTEALIAAKLSRNLERPRVETDGRFDRAIRLANDDGTYRQQLEARYERIWTAYWWFDDIALANQAYDEFESFALESNHALNLQFLVHLLQLMFNAVVHGHLSPEVARIDQRIAALRNALEPMAKDADRPNNQLEAQTSLAIIRLNVAMRGRDRAAISAVWKEFSDILGRAAGMGEYDAQRLISMIEVAGDITTNDPEYDTLIEQVADFTAERTSEAEGALVLLKRACQIEFDRKFDMIRLLGKAAARLTKKEHSEHLIEAQQLLMLAYRSAGLLWAARATCVMAAASIVIEGEEDSQLPVSFVPTDKIWAWIVLENGLLPDFLLAMQLLGGALASLPLDETSQEKVRNDIQELDIALGCRFLNASDEDLRRLESLPDLLERMGLLMSRTALLFALGYADALREDGSIPPEETDEDVTRYFSMWASQPVAKQMLEHLLLNEGEEQVASTRLVGLKVEVRSDTTDYSLMMQQAVLGSLEVFFATLIEHKVMPHAEKFSIQIVEVDGLLEPSFDVDHLRPSAILSWPKGRSPAEFSYQDQTIRFLAEVTSKVLAAAFWIDDIKELLGVLFGDEAVQNRIAMILASATSYHRITGRSVMRMQNWKEKMETPYALRLPRPVLNKVDLSSLVRDEDEESGDAEVHSGPRMPDDHRGVGVLSVIDMHAWNAATWRGAGYLEIDVNFPPIMALLFENRDAATRIFERWRERFGQRDQHDDIRIAIIRDIFADRPHHYAVQISPRMPNTDDKEANRTILTTTRSLLMEPSTSTNLDRFLASYARYGVYHLIPAIISSGEPEWIPNLNILKRDLTVISAADVGEHDIERSALEMILRREAEEI